MDNFRTLDKTLRQQSETLTYENEEDVSAYGRSIALLENVVAVVSDLAKGASKVFSGKFGIRLGLENYHAAASIWESAILERMTAEEREAKFLAELRFFHYLKKLPKKQRSTRYLAMKLRIADATGEMIDIMHRMYYIYDADGQTVRFAVCLYGPLTFDFTGRSAVVDSMTGNMEELTSASDNRILSAREIQVLSLIERGNTSAGIAECLSISRHTVSRHRQEILAKLQVKNSPEACRLAKSLGLI